MLYLFSFTRLSVSYSRLYSVDVTKVGEWQIGKDFEGRRPRIVLVENEE